MNLFRASSILALVCLSALCVRPVAAAPAPIATLAELEAQARARTTRQARLPLSSSADVFLGLESFEPASSGRVPNYLRALAVKPATVKPFAHLIRTFAYGGTLSPALKLAMATRIAQVNRSAYGAVHLARLLRNTVTRCSRGCGRTSSSSWLRPTASRCAGPNCRRRTSAG